MPAAIGAKVRRVLYLDHARVLPHAFDTAAQAAQGDALMKGAWPKVTGQIRFDFDADHSMPRIGKHCEVRHTHSYSVWFGWTHEIHPISGYTHEYLKQNNEFQRVVSKVAGQYLNDILPMQPSAEVLAMWLLFNIEPAYCDHVIVETYGNYRARADRSGQRSEWAEFFAGRGPDPYSNHVFTLK